MSKALSLDLSARVQAAFEARATHREAGDRFGVNAANVGRSRERKREEGEPRPKALGGDRRSNHIKIYQGTDHRDLREGEGGIPIPDLCREHANSTVAFYG